MEKKEKLKYFISAFLWCFIVFPILTIIVSSIIAPELSFLNNNRYKFHIKDGYINIFDSRTGVVKQFAGELHNTYEFSDDSLTFKRTKIEQIID